VLVSGAAHPFICEGDLDTGFFIMPFLLFKLNFMALLYKTL